MASEQKERIIAIATDGSDNSKYAFKCKYDGFLLKLCSYVYTYRMNQGACSVTYTAR